MFQDEVFNFIVSAVCTGFHHNKAGSEYFLYIQLFNFNYGKGLKNPRRDFDIAVNLGNICFISFSSLCLLLFIITFLFESILKIVCK